MQKVLNAQRAIKKVGIKVYNPSTTTPTMNEGGSYMSSAVGFESASPKHNFAESGQDLQPKILDSSKIKVVDSEIIK